MSTTQESPVDVKQLYVRLPGDDVYATHTFIRCVVCGGLSSERRGVDPRFENEVVHEVQHRSGSEQSCWKVYTNQSVSSAA